MLRLKRWIVALVAGMALAGSAEAAEWGRFYHYPYSYFPQNYRRPFRSRDFDTRNGYPMYPAYMAFPPYFRKDLYYPFLQDREPGNNRSGRHQGLHYTLDVF